MRLPGPIGVCGAGQTRERVYNCRSVAVPAPPPAFLITIDTEGDDLWSRPRSVTTRNAEYLERFQQLCEAHALRPTWLTNHEMIMSPVFRSFAADVIARGTAEIGMHLHAWDSPPLVPLTADDAACQPYLIEYPAPVMREKIRALTGLLEDTLGVKMTSHRAGRWGFDERYAEMLVEEGYVVDCSVTPLVTWRSSIGAPERGGGPDYRRFPSEPYRVDLGDISRPGDSPLLEIPATVLSGWGDSPESWVSAGERLPGALGVSAAAVARIANRLSRRTLWLRPDGRNRGDLLRVLGRIRAGEASYGEFVLHSSELMPGGSPTFATSPAVEDVYSDMRALFVAAQDGFKGATLTEFERDHARVSGRSR